LKVVNIGGFAIRNERMKIFMADVTVNYSSLCCLDRSEGERERGVSGFMGF
jgi:hypothetical protein